MDGTFGACLAILKCKPLVVWRLYDEGFVAWLERALAELTPDGAPGVSLQVTVRDRREADIVSREFRKRTGG